MIVRGLPNEAELHAIVRRALEPHREDRYQTAGEMLHDLERYASAAGLAGSESELAEFLAESFPDEVEAQRQRRERFLAAEDLASDETPSAPVVGRPSVASGPRRIQRPRPAPEARAVETDREPRRLADLVVIGSLACAATLAALSVLRTLGVL